MTLADERQGKVRVLGPLHGKVVLFGSFPVVSGTNRTYGDLLSHAQIRKHFSFYSPPSLSKKLIKAQDFLRSFNDTARIVIN